LLLLVLTGRGERRRERQTHDDGDDTAAFPAQLPVIA
jgi:hypothetical protein